MDDEVRQMMQLSFLNQLSLKSLLLQGQYLDHFKCHPGEGYRKVKVEILV